MGINKKNTNLNGTVLKRWTHHKLLQHVAYAAIGGIIKTKKMILSIHFVAISAMANKNIVGIYKEISPTSLMGRLVLLTSVVTNDGTVHN